MSFNIQEIMQKAKEMQSRMKHVDDELSKIEVTGESGAGMIKITMSCKHDASNIDISDTAMQENKEILQDLILAAINDANRKIAAATKNRLSDLSQELGIPTDALEGQLGD
ncbi:MAG: YbaB/EbfC family nucleoid-associated protein [Gammaproteobacteria bacterium]|nr:YbaB/EbfC family nucleoid-associated protein [Gammaproteobacteria bacterium]